MKFFRGLFFVCTILAFQTTGASVSGKIKIYFNHPVNTSVSSGTDAVFLNQTLDDTLVAYVNRAKYTLDIAVYDYIQSADIADIAAAVNNAFLRGVTVRWIYNSSSSNSGLSSLNNNIHTLASPTGGSYGIMHNKFMVIDANSANSSDAIVWTGSCNWTSQQFYHDVNNTIILQDQLLAQAYTAEFNQMWGGTGVTPNNANSKFGPDKTDVVNHSFTIDGKQVELYFSPYSVTNSQIINAVKNADKEIYFGIYTFTYTEIADSIISKIQQQSVHTLGIMDNFSVTYTPYAVLSPVMQTNLQIFNVSNYLYHNKLIIVDANHPLLDPLVITGSHNWSTAANTKNDENSIFIHDSTIANIYYQSFLQNFIDLNPAADLHDMANEMIEMNLYPNPAGEMLTVAFENNVAETVFCFDALGKKYSLPVKVQPHQWQLNTSGLAPGIYCIRAGSSSKLFVKQ
jgi:phosphatidylserine/phosphatidylglycerophosphate/cardiolipin synthase-like enzyme